MTLAAGNRVEERRGQLAGAEEIESLRGSLRHLLITLMHEGESSTEAGAGADSGPAAPRASAP